MWQYSSTGKVNGINGSVDLDYSYIDYPAVIKAAGLNGFSKPSSAAAVSNSSTSDKTAQTSAQRGSCDVNGDGKVSVADVLAVAEVIKKGGTK